MEQEDLENPFENGGPVRIPVDGELDLHTFSPREVSGLLEDYLEECQKAGILEVRVVCGKGTGALRRSVEACLQRNPRVAGFSQAPPKAGGWGALLVRVRK
jgi:DNA-nicking Smr family endonuclease